MIWCDIGPCGIGYSTAFQFLAVNEVDGLGLINIVRCAHQAKISKLMHSSHRRRCINYLEIAARQSASVIMVSGLMCSTKLKRRQGFSSAVIILAKISLISLLKSFINEELKCKANLNCNVMHF